MNEAIVYQLEPIRFALTTHRLVSVGKILSTVPSSWFAASFSPHKDTVAGKNWVSRQLTRPRDDWAVYVTYANRPLDFTDGAAFGAFMMTGVNLLGPNFAKSVEPDHRYFPAAQSIGVLLLAQDLTVAAAETLKLELTEATQKIRKLWNEERAKDSASEAQKVEDELRGLGKIS